MISTDALIITLSAIPSELTLRNHPNTMFVGVGLFLGFLLIAFAKLSRGNVYSTLMISLIKLKSFQTFVKELHPINKRESVILLINYLISFGLVIFILANMRGVEIKNELILVGLVPAVSFLWPLLCFQVVGIVVGERQIFVEPMQMKYVGTQFVGVFYFVLALIWTINTMPESLFINLVIFIYFSESVLRIIKSAVIVYIKGVSWYYIILYLCTLEILPLFVIIYFMMRDFIY